MVLVPLRSGGGDAAAVAAAEPVTAGGAVADPALEAALGCDEGGEAAAPPGPIFVEARARMAAKF